MSRKSKASKARKFEAFKSRIKDLKAAHRASGATVSSSSLASHLPSRQFPGKNAKERRLNKRKARITYFKNLANGVLSDEHTNNNMHNTGATASSLASKPLDAVRPSSCMDLELKADIDESSGELHEMSSAKAPQKPVKTPKYEVIPSEGCSTSVYMNEGIGELCYKEEDESRNGSKDVVPPRVLEYFRYLDTQCTGWMDMTRDLFEMKGIRPEDKAAEQALRRRHREMTEGLSAARRALGAEWCEIIREKK